MQRSLRSVAERVANIYYFELLRATEGMLSR
jgi:hypothetical protein